MHSSADLPASRRRFNGFDHDGRSMLAHPLPTINAAAVMANATDRAAARNSLRGGRANREVRVALT